MSPESIIVTHFRDVRKLESCENRTFSAEHVLYGTPPGVALSRLTGGKMTIKIIPNEKGNPPGKLADAEIHFTEEPVVRQNRVWRTP
jgi:hypothetical protein